MFSWDVKDYLKLAKQNKSMLNKPAPTPVLADGDKDYDEDNEPKRQLQSIAAQVITNILYGARMARYDLLHSCQILACYVTKWTKQCDQRLLRIVSYRHSLEH